MFTKKSEPKDEILTEKLLTYLSVSKILFLSSREHHIDFFYFTFDL
jgi:hypothetical protein